MASARASSAARNRPASSSTTSQSSSGRALQLASAGRRRAPATSCERSNARAEAERGASSNSGISPKKSPGSMRATNDSRPSVERLPIPTRPLRTTNSSCASSPSLNRMSLRSRRTVPPCRRGAGRRPSSRRRTARNAPAERRPPCRQTYPGCAHAGPRLPPGSPQDARSRGRSRRQYYERPAAPNGHAERCSRSSRCRSLSNRPVTLAGLSAREGVPWK